MLINTVYTTMTCEADGCDRTITYLASDEQAELQKPENAWVLKAARVVRNLIPAPGQKDPQSRLYCSDVCEIKATESGVHNVPEPKRIISNVADPQQVAAVAAAAKRAAQATEAIKAGEPVILG